MQLDTNLIALYNTVYQAAKGEAESVEIAGAPIKPALKGAPRGVLIKERVPIKPAPQWAPRGAPIKEPVPIKPAPKGAAPRGAPIKERVPTKPTHRGQQQEEHRLREKQR